MIRIGIKHIELTSVLQSEWVVCGISYWAYTPFPYEMCRQPRATCHYTICNNKLSYELLIKEVILKILFYDKWVL